MVKVAVIGVGNLGVEVIKALHYKQAEIVAVFTRSSNLDKDVGEVVKIGPIGVKIKAISEAKETLSTLKPEICLIQTQGGLSYNESLYKMCADLGINVLTLIEEAFYPKWETSSTAKQLDKVFKEKKCTFSGSGNQDFLCSTVLTALSCVEEVKEIKIVSNVDVSQYFRSQSKEKAKGLLNALGIGIAMHEFQAAMEVSLYQDKEETPDGIMGNIIRWLCAALGWEIKQMKVEPWKPITSSKDIYVKILDETIPSGYVTGLEEHVTGETEHGVKIVISFRFFESEERMNDIYTCIDLDSNPKMSLKFAENDIVQLTVNPYVNRILDIIKAPPGYVTTDKLPHLCPVNSLK